jgi:hypothetical protein
VVAVTRASVLIVLAACSFHTNNSTVTSDAPRPHDARTIDSPPDVYDPGCFGSGAFYVCLSGVPSGTITLPSTLDTTQCMPAGGQTAMVGATPVCAIAADIITVDSCGVTGGLPLVLVATSDININTSLDASSSIGNVGPGASFTGCATTLGGAGGATGGGGAGGSFGSMGANGGTGGGTPGGTAAPAAQSPVDTLRAGCPGGAGGGGGPADGGPGGGAVYLIARGSINVNGVITVSGAGGVGGHSSKGGGGGGGSGGMIVVHAGQLQINSGGQVFANGGGGGGGANQIDGANGANATQLGTAAPGGPDQSAGTCAGGDGAFQTSPATNVDGANGGGGGGGGVGVIRVLAGGTIPPGQVSPPPS